MTYLSLKQAAEITGKSERTIRRLCNAVKSENYVTYEDGKLLIDANYLEQNYPMTQVPKSVNFVKSEDSHNHDMDSQNVKPMSQTDIPDNLAYKVAMLELELKYKDELFHKVTMEKDLRIEALERSLLLLGEGVRREPATTQAQHSNQVNQGEEPVKKKRWWQW